MAAYLRLSNLAMRRLAPLMHCLLTMAATSQMASLRRLRLLAFYVMLIFPGKKPPRLSATSRLGKRWVYCRLAADHDGTCQIVTLSDLSDQKTFTNNNFSVNFPFSVLRTRQFQKPLLKNSTRIRKTTEFRASFISIEFV